MADGQTHSFVEALNAPNKSAVEAPDPLALQTKLRACIEQMNGGFLRLQRTFDPQDLGYKLGRHDEIVFPDNPTSEQILAADIYANSVHKIRSGCTGFILGSNRNPFPPHAKDVAQRGVRAGAEMLTQLQEVEKRTNQNFSDFIEPLQEYVTTCRQFLHQQEQFEQAQKPTELQ